MKPRRAFTLVEMIVVLAVIALLSAITLGVVTSLREGNKRSTCQVNLNQIYSAARLYAQDFDDQFPYLNPAGGPSSAQTPAGGLGLWALYAYPPSPKDTLRDSNCNSIADDLPVMRDDLLRDSPLAAYLKSPRVFHCPDDNFDHSVSYSTGSATCATTTLRSKELSFDPGDGVKRLNPYYLSYQGQDDKPSVATYSTFRGSDVKRQLRFYKDNAGTIEVPTRVAPDQTVVTWCRFHRALNADGTTTAGNNSLDNVLFLDGSVQSVRVSQGVTDTGGSTKNCDGWKRVPLVEANNSPTVATSACN